MQEINYAGYSGYHFIDLSGCWNPEAGPEYEYHTAAQLLRLCKSIGQYKGDAITITAFLDKNGSLKYFNDLNDDEKTDLNSFLVWLKKFRRINTAYFERKLNNFKQRSKCFRSYYIDLLSLYTKSCDLEDETEFSNSDKKEIFRRFIRGFDDQKVRMHSALKFAQNPTMKIDELINYAEDITIALRDIEDSNEVDQCSQEVKIGTTIEQKNEDEYYENNQKFDLQDIIKETENNCSQLLHKIKKTIENLTQSKKRTSRMICNYCKGRGHKAKDCKERKTPYYLERDENQQNYQLCDKKWQNSGRIQQYDEKPRIFDKYNVEHAGLQEYDSISQNIDDPYFHTMHLSCL